MLCFEVSVNDKQPITMGHKELAHMSLSLSYTPEVSSLNLSSFGGLRKVTSPDDVVSWFDSELSVGDQVTIKIVESLKADNPVTPSSTKAEKQRTLYCAFCGSPKTDDCRMVVSVLCICEKCVALCQSVLNNG